MKLRHATRISLPLPLPDSLQEKLPSMGISLPYQLQGASAKRKEEFLAGRYCAMTAMLKFVESALPVGFNEDQSPRWPEGLVGSITHCQGLAAAAVAPSPLLRGIGIDTENLMSPATAFRVRRRILTGKELKNCEDPEWVTLVFSAKESIYKCLRPLCGRFFGFEDAELVEVDEKGTFRFRLLTEIGGGIYKNFEGEGVFAKAEGRIHTAFEFPW